MLLNELRFVLDTLIDAAPDGAEYSLACGGITQDRPSNQGARRAGCRCGP